MAAGLDSYSFQNSDSSSNKKLFLIYIEMEDTTFTTQTNDFEEESGFLIDPGKIKFPFIHIYKESVLLW